MLLSRGGWFSRPGGINGKLTGGQLRDDVSPTNLGQSLLEGAEAPKRDLVDYLNAIPGCIIPELRDRSLSAVRVLLRRHAPFMQKNVPQVHVVYRFRTQPGAHDLRFGQKDGVWQDRGFCLFVSSIRS